MRVLVNLSGESSWLNHSRPLGMVLKWVLESLVTVNQLYLKTHEVPPLYKSGVRYRNEPRGKMVFNLSTHDRIGKHYKKNVEGSIEEFAAIPVVYMRGFGDCDDLAPWRCAELRCQGESAKIRIQWKRTPRGKLFHIVVRREDGSVEDPSRILGMGLPIQWKDPRK